MEKVKKPVSEEDVVKALEDISDDPESYNAFIDQWNSIFSLSRQHGISEFANVEAAAFVSINSTDDFSATSTVGRQVGHLLEKFDTPAYMVEESGRIAAQNIAAIQAYNIDSNGTLDDLPFDLERDQMITDAIISSLNPMRNMHDAVLKRAYSRDGEDTATLSIAPSKSNNGQANVALVFVIDARWKTNAAGLFQREFDLSNAEQELLVGFLDGQTTQMMAKSRNRAHTTIRSQFHSMMGKMGARTQTELLRNALSVSQFVDQIEEIADVMRHPHRKRVDVVRPGGRSVEVTMAGDLSGKPIVFLQSCVAYTFESKVEQVFRDSGFCVLSICRPGYGDTDPPNKGEGYFETFVADLEALLDQLGHEHCMIMSANTSSSWMFEVSALFPSKVKGLIQVASCVPITYHKDVGSSIPWAQGVIHAAEKHPAFSEFMIKAGMRAWKTLGQSKFMRTQFRNQPTELALTTDPEALKESQAALDVATKQNLDSCVYDTRITFSDFSKGVSSTDLPILTIHGVIDPVFPIEAIRIFAQDFESRTTLVEIAGAGYSAMTTHTEEIMQTIATFYRENSDSTKG